MNENLQEFNHLKARKVRVQLGLTQKQVADDLTNESQGLIGISNTKISRFEKGDSVLDNMTQQLLYKYLATKLQETELYEPNNEQEPPKQPSVVSSNNANSNSTDSSANSVQDEAEGFYIVNEPPLPGKDESQPKKVAPGLNSQDLIRFNPNLNETIKTVLIDKFHVLAAQLDESLELKIEKNIFGISNQSQDDARSCVYAMAGLYNIIRALQGSPIFPINESEESIIDKENILSIVQEPFFHFTGQGPSTLEPIE